MPRLREFVTAPVVIAPRVKRVQRMINDDARANLTSEYFTDLYQAWQAKGQAVLETVAMLYPDVFLRVVSSHMPREMHATVTNIKLDRLSNAELEQIIAAGLERGFDGEEAQEDPVRLQQLGTPESV
jgi:hypothetical protein